MTTWRLLLTSPLPLRLIFLLTLLLWLSNAWTLLGDLKRRQFLPLLLRMLALLLMTTLLLQPALQIDDVTTVPGRIAVVVDDSQSMAMHDGEPQSRFEQATQWLETQSPALQSLGHVLEYSGLTGSAGMPHEANGAESALLKRIQSLIQQPLAAQPLVGIVLLSDGADTELMASDAEALRRAVAQGVAPKEGAAQIPVNVVALGHTQGFDLAVDSLQTPSIAFVRTPLEISVSLHFTGQGAVQTQVELRDDQGLTQQKTLVMSEAQPGAQLSFTLTPDQVGSRFYTVTARAQSANERLLVNNVRAFKLKVLRDRIRVLHISGRPSWDTRFVRSYLKGNRNIDLISFFILRGLTDNPQATQQDLSLIEFPTHELFDQSLASFDAVIVQNFDYRTFQITPQLLSNLRRYVEAGGALMMLGGEHSFGLGGYGQSPLSEILPVMMAQSDEISERPFHPTAVTHPILNGLTAPALLPELRNYNRTLGLAAGAQALLLHPTDRTPSGAAQPLLAIKEAGHGRTLAMMSDDFWRWSFTARSDHPGDATYDTLWAHMLSWLMRDPATARILLQSPSEPLSPGPTIPIAAQLLDERYQPQEGGALQFTLTPLLTWPEPVTPQTASLHLEAISDASGMAKASAALTSAGIYRLSARRVADNAEPEESVSDLLTVQEAGPEPQALLPRHDFLQMLARSSGGTFQSVTTARVAPLNFAHERTRILRPAHRLALWHHWTLGLFLLLLLCTEWWLRRRAERL